MAYWLFKSEPKIWSWTQQKKKGAKGEHFGALRGKDFWKNCDSVIIVGRNEPPPRAIDRLTRGLFADDPERLRLVGDGRFPRRPRGYRLRNGDQLGVETAIHPDPRGQKVLELVRERESAQAIDRLRLVHAKTAKRVIILSSVPLDITVDELRTLDELAGTPGRIGPRARLREAFDLAGILPLGQRDLSKTHPELFPSQARAKDALRALRTEAINRGGNQIEYLFGIHPHLRIAIYRRAGQRGKSSQVICDTARHPDSKSKQSSLLGEKLDAFMFNTSSSGRDGVMQRDETNA